jgi:glycerol-3-phosphate acyltransferase PlsY
MSSYLALFASIIIAYLIGSFPTSFIFAKLLKGVDIREVGSGNAGATNVARTVGKIPGILTLVVDMLKGVLVVTVITNFFYSFDIDLDYNFYRGLMALTVVCGHIWSVFLNFRGGKGVATTLGVGAAMALPVLLPVVGIWILIFALTSYVSLASIISLIVFPILAALFRYPFYTVLFSAIICFISIYKHKDNLRRLLKGEEHAIKILKNK